MTTTTTKYELTDADRERLDAIAQKAGGKPKVDDIAWEIACDWFASLPVVSRKAVERALGEVTEAEAERHDDDYLTHEDALGRFLARRRAMLDDATVEPPKVEPTPEPQPVIDVVAELAELRRLIDLFRESQAKHQDTTRTHGWRFDDVYRRVVDLEFARRRPWWRWW